MLDVDVCRWVDNHIEGVILVRREDCSYMDGRGGRKEGKRDAVDVEVCEDVRW